MLHVHRAERADRLADGLAEILREPLDDPFTAEVVSVPAKGVERWLTQRLSHRLGAGGRAATGLRQRAVPVGVRAGRGRGRRRRVGSDRRRRSVAARPPGVGGAGRHRRLRRRGVVPAAGRVPRRAGRRRAPARSPVRHRPAPGRRCSTRTAGTGPTCSAPGRPARTSTASAARCLTTCGGRPSCGGGCASRSACRARPSGSPRCARRCASDPERSALPPRLSVFGPTRLPTAHIAVLAALAEQRDVHLWLPHPSPALWERLRPHARARGVRCRGGATRRASCPAIRCWPRWGSDARELQLVARRRGRGDGPTHHHRRLRPGRPRCSAGCRPRRGRATMPPGGPTGRRWTRPTAACRCTPATAPTGRSRCCAR